jgi:hypothetical protein
MSKSQWTRCGITAAAGCPRRALLRRQVPFAVPRQSTAHAFRVWPCSNCQGVPVAPPRTSGHIREYVGLTSIKNTPAPRRAAVPPMPLWTHGCFRDPPLLGPFRHRYPVVGLAPVADSRERQLLGGHASDLIAFATTSSELFCSSPLVRRLPDSAVAAGARQHL